jgi:putative addiction module CopG family antidote
MATSTLNLVGTFEEFAKPLVESGRYKNADEVMTAAMDALMREEADDKAKANFVRRAIEEGEASGVYEGDIFADLRAKYQLPPRQ